MANAEYGYYDDMNWAKKLDSVSDTRHDFVKNEGWGWIPDKCWPVAGPYEKDGYWCDKEDDKRDAKPGKCRLLRLIQCVEFALIDSALFLDTHPRDRAALEYYLRIRIKLKELVKIYTEQYGPLTLKQVLSRNYWTWVCEPWPWEKEC